MTRKKYEKPLGVDLPFDEALERFAQTEKSELDREVVTSRTAPDLIKDLLTSFEKAAHHDDQGEYWLARELYPLLGYKSWQKFEPVIDKAKKACDGVGESTENHFIHVDEMVPIGSGAQRTQPDLELTRFACYLIAQNGDPTRRPEIAAAQTYFAVQTQRQEQADQAADEPLSLSEDERRVLARDELKAHNKSLAGAAKSVGVKTPVEYAVFQNHGYKGLYAGLDRRGIQRRKKLSEKQDILDHMPSAELAANLFRATQTEEQLNKLREQGKTGKDLANRTHHAIGAKVRETIKSIGGTMPEDYPAVDHVKEARKRIKAGETKKLDKKG
ncbi:DNA damage-inducible protein D [Hyphomicrobium sp. CS1GBMeth3]|uniref:DNA damage-inducible protein D n=1 Tax=Hyphomicrobium sp. CS1GBMeth3 TaxID=1892845 RepID=UPI0009F957E6|nr:DNA damage-inducible protein D [Hyphomicrobium sp. CS1GBMeth3]